MLIELIKLKQRQVRFFLLSEEKEILVLAEYL